MKNGKPAISVVIPAFNEEKYLPSCLESISQQTFRDFELIVVDNNSTDKTEEIAKKFGAIVVKETIQGMIPARERGFKEAKAEIIARTDADTKVTPNWLQIIYSTFQKHPEAVAMTGAFISPTKKIPDKLISSQIKLIQVKLAKLFTNHIHLIGFNMALRKSAWEKINCHTNDKQVHEDIDLSCHLSEIGKILYVPGMKVVFSFRRITNNPIKGISDYLGDYVIRYIKTINLHNSHIHKHFRTFLPKVKIRR
jgi:glycosyltransferase involved in cell wall biosynthesis